MPPGTVCPRGAGRIWLLQFNSGMQKEGVRSEMLAIGWVLGPGLVKGNQSQTVVRAVKPGLLQELL